MRTLGTSLRDGVEAEIRTRILGGQLAAGSRINEVHLAQELAVSRTPLREALTRLAGEHFVEARPRFGFYVRPLSAAEHRDLYAIRARLDPWALELAGVPPKDQLTDLEIVNAELAELTDPGKAIEHDDRWHFMLLAGCPNHTLIELIRQMMWRTRRYEHLYFGDPKSIASAVREHATILRALRRRDLAEACRRLHDNMTSGIDVLQARLAELP
ncbi:MAG: GntR family transcriptional regulator [Acidobacteriota bacterium]